ncbi:hypothetical protein L218DRAFT_630707 [Marasmius fiardii PR-910]|nr:hypothetical protein L218DRAFT_630707 [Marasmius fiardii PR-910]
MAEGLLTGILTSTNVILASSFAIYDIMSGDNKQNFGDTLSGGIQDISALLPLLGTEQCERHAGSALDKGFLYAAATPLSIFGSLGVAKTAYVTLIATSTSTIGISTIQSG